MDRNNMDESELLKLRKAKTLYNFQKGTPRSFSDYITRLEYTTAKNLDMRCGCSSSNVITTIDPIWATYISGNNNTRTTGISVDSNGNVYVTGYYTTPITIYDAIGNPVKILPNSGTTNSIIVKYNPDGTPLWATYCSTSKGTGYYASPSVDSNGNVYASGNYYGTATIYNANGDAVKILPDSGTYAFVMIVKYNPDGGFLWATHIGSNKNNNVATNGISVDSNGNVYVIGNYQANVFIYKLDGTTLFKTLPDSGGNRHTCIVKYTTDGDPSWATRITSPDIGLTGISVDSNGNVYVTGTYIGTSTIYNLDGTTFKLLPNSGDNVNGIIVKYTTLGVPSWVTHIGSNKSNMWLTGISVDSNGNVYVTGNYYGTATIYNANGDAVKTLPDSGIDTTNGMIVKYTTLGVPSWATYIGSNNNNSVTLSGIFVDSNGNVYVAGDYVATATIYSQSEAPFKTLVSTGFDDGMIVIYNTNGDPQQATHIGSGNSTTLNRIYVNSYGNVYVTGDYGGSTIIYYQNGTPFKTLPDTSYYNGFIVKYTTLRVPQ